VQGVSWSPDRGRIATASDDRTVRIWDAELGTELLTLRGHRDAVWAVAWSPDGARIATASRDRTGRIWDSRHGTELVVLNGHEEWAGSVAWSPDGHHLAVTAPWRTDDLETNQIALVDAAGGALEIVAGERSHDTAARWGSDGSLWFVSDADTPTVMRMSDGTLVAAIYPVALPRPRSLAMMGDPAFVALTQQIRRHFYSQGTLDA